MHEWIDHTSEMELHVHAATDHDVVADATMALAGILGEPDPDGRATIRELAVGAHGRPGDRAGLLAAWLEELVYLAESEALIPAERPATQLTDDELRATLPLASCHPSHLVKAVTYHALTFEPDRNGWHATVVLDV